MFDSIFQVFPTSHVCIIRVAPMILVKKGSKSGPYSDPLRRSPGCPGSPETRPGSSRSLDPGVPSPEAGDVFPRAGRLSGTSGPGLAFQPWTSGTQGYTIPYPTCRPHTVPGYTKVDNAPHPGHTAGYVHYLSCHASPVTEINGNLSPCYANHDETNS